MNSLEYGLAKLDAYNKTIEFLQALVENQRNWVCNSANAASLLYHMFKSLSPPASAVNWAGFYVVDPKQPYQLILGPFQGKIACQTIEFGKGVCGTVASSGRSLKVEDVNAFPGHIACDGDSKSEIVVPIRSKGKVSATALVICLADSFS